MLIISGVVTGVSKNPSQSYQVGQFHHTATVLPQETGSVACLTVGSVYSSSAKTSVYYLIAETVFFSYGDCHVSALVFLLPARPGTSLDWGKQLAIRRVW